MSVVLLFEAQVQPGRLEAYVHYALEAQRDLAAADGCLSTEQLMAVDEARRIMVKSIWRDSASAQAWNRTNGALLAERAARLSLFEDYSVSLLCPAEFTPSAAPAPKIREAAAAAGWDARGGDEERFPAAAVTASMQISAPDCGGFSSPSTAI